MDVLCVSERERKNKVKIEGEDGSYGEYSGGAIPLN